MKFRNFTLYTVNIFDAAGEKIILSVEPEKTQVRVDGKIMSLGAINGIPVITKRMGEVNGLPEKQEDVYLLVSVIVLQAIKQDGNLYERVDVLCPDTGPESVVRNKNGQILGVRRFMA